MKRCFNSGILISFNFTLFILQFVEKLYKVRRERFKKTVQHKVLKGLTEINRINFPVCLCRMFIYEIHGFSLNIKQLHLSATFYCDILDFLKLNTNIFSSPTVKKPIVRWENFQNLEFQNRIHKECVTKNISQLNYSFLLLSKF